MGLQGFTCQKKFGSQNFECSRTLGLKVLELELQLKVSRPDFRITTGISGFQGSKG